MVGTLALGLAVLYVHAVDHESKIKEAQVMAVYKTAEACEDILDNPAVQAKLFDAVVGMDNVKQLQLFCLELPKEPTSTIDRGI